MTKAKYQQLSCFINYNKHFSGIRLKILATLLIAIIIQSALYGQNDSLKVQKLRENEMYIEKLDTLANFKLNVNDEFEYFKQEGDNFAFDIRPNIALSSRLSFNYRFISVGVGFTPKFIPGNNDNEKEGKTKTFSLGISINSDHLIQTIQAGKVKGFYLHNTQDFVPDWDSEKDPYLQLPDLKISEIRGSTSYKFNENYSIKSISTQTEIQLKSCGTFLPTISYMFYKIDRGDISENQKTTQQSNNFQVTLSPGYFYTYVINSKFYAAAGLSAGIGIDWTWLTTTLNPEEVQKDSYHNPVYKFRERIGLGYNSKKLYAGGELSLSQALQKINHTSLQQQAKRVYFQIFMGYRFLAPRFLSRETKTLIDKAPLRLRNLVE